MATVKRTRVATLTAVGLVAMLTLAACSGPAQDSQGSGFEGVGASESSELTNSGLRSVSIDPNAVSDGAKMQEGASELVVADESAQIFSSSLELRVKSPSETATTIRSLMEEVGGKVSYSTETPGSEYGYSSAQLTLRLPPESLDSTVETLKGYGTVISSESGSQDVSQQKTDYEVRIKSLETSIERLNGLLSQSQTTSDLIEIERELQTRESTLESMQASLDGLNDLIDYATVSVSLTADNRDVDAQKVNPDSFSSGFQRGLEGLMAFGAGLLVVLGVSLPWLLLLGALGSIVMIFLTIRKRRKAKRRGATAAGATGITPSKPTKAEEQTTTTTGEQDGSRRAEEG